MAASFRSRQCDGGNLRASESLAVWPCFGHGTTIKGLESQRLTICDSILIAVSRDDCSHDRRITFRPGNFRRLLP